MNFLPNEIEIVSTANKNIILTNVRIINEEIKFGSDYYLSIFLEDISSVELHYKSNTKILIFGVLFVLYSFYNMMSNYSPISLKLVPLLFGGILIAYWWFTRVFTISIKPNGGERLDCSFQVSTDNNIRDFLNNIELAKMNRVNALNNFSNLQNISSVQPLNNAISANPFCPACKHSIKPEDKFCENCGCNLK